MKTQLMNKTLVALALGSLVMITTGAHANDTRNSNEYGNRSTAVVQVEVATQPNRNEAREPVFQHNHDNRGDYAYQQSQKFSQQINARQHRQMDRIQADRRSGSLTRFEFRELMHEQRHIRSMEQNFLADGIIDPREFQRLDRALDQASRSIRAENRDQQARNHHGYNSRWN
ncbi:MAG: hypothetical protein Q8K12_09835 [Thiobacillus sp.]|nr:hypothetical protein [Thiobacillus sp.]